MTPEKYKMNPDDHNYYTIVSQQSLPADVGVPIVAVVGMTSVGMAVVAESVVGFMAGV